jgi:hypothetical protein
MPFGGMSDGRMTEWKSSCQVNQDFQNKFKVQTGPEYRKYLQEKVPTVVKPFEQVKN